MRPRKLIHAVLVALALLSEVGPAASAAPSPPDDAVLAGLCDGARAGVVALFERVPGVVVTSAARDRAAEARAWAGRVAKKRTWLRILRAGRDGTLAPVQAWIDAHWREVRGRPEPIRAYLAAYFDTLTDAEMAALSPHAGGRAVDLRKQRRLSRALLRRLPNRTVVLDEGDHWHVTFRCAP